MEDLKIRVNTEQESKEAQELFFELGCYWQGGSCENKVIDVPSGRYIFSRRGAMTHCDSSEVELNGVGSGLKEITLPQLKDMVVLKRNNPKDANVYQDGDVPCLYDLYLTESEDLYFYHCGKEKWVLSNLNHDKYYYELLKPIEKEMKESLNDKVASAEVARQEEKTALDDLLKLRDSDKVIKNRSAWDRQIGGLHYKDFAIQPMQFALANQLDYAQANVIKYVTRHAQKNGKQDLLKAIHNIELMIEYYYPE